MGHATDELIDLAHQVSKNPPHREMDMLLTAGERISMALLSMALADYGVPAVSFTGSQTGIITDGSHRRARIKKILGDRVRMALNDGKVAIVAGFQGISENKEITTLGRGGSDTTAVALAAAFKADLCEIYTDVDGVYSADPRVVPSARLLKRISHDAMVEMANRGAGVLHPRCVELAKRYGVALKVRNSLNDSEGTMIGSSGGMEEFSVTGVTADRGKFLLSVKLARPTVVGALLDRAAHAHWVVLAPVFTEEGVQFFADRDVEGEWRRHLDELQTQGFVKKYEFGAQWAPLSVIGERFSQDGAALSQVMEILARHEISVTIGSASSLSITVAVPLSRVDEALGALHDEFIR